MDNDDMDKHRWAEGRCLCMSGFLESVSKPECVVAPSSKSCSPNEFWSETDNKCVECDEICASCIGSADNCIICSENAIRDDKGFNLEMNVKDE